MLMGGVVFLLNKEEILQLILNYLEENHKTSMGAIHGHVEHILTDKGLIGAITTGNQYMRTTEFKRIPDDVAMGINEVVYDLIVLRILTPGMDRDNLEWPWLTVTGPDRIKDFKK